MKGSITEDWWDTWRYPSEHWDADCQKSEISSFACYLLNSKKDRYSNRPQSRLTVNHGFPPAHEKKRKDLYLRSLKTAAVEIRKCFEPELKSFQGRENWQPVARFRRNSMNFSYKWTQKHQCDNVWRSTPLYGTLFVWYWCIGKPRRSRKTLKCMLSILLNFAYQRTIGTYIFCVRCAMQISQPGKTAVGTFWDKWFRYYHHDHDQHHHRRHHHDHDQHHLQVFWAGTIMLL